MEARLIHVRKHAAKQPAGQSPFYIHKENCGGIPVRQLEAEGLTANHLIKINQEASDFLLETLGPKGAWSGWVLTAIGRLSDGIHGIYFDMVLARNMEAMTPLTPDTPDIEYFEKACSDGKGGMK